MFIPRTVSAFVLQNAEWFPVVSITGPRQSGKSTLAKHLFDSYEYVNLEDVSIRAFAQQDPIGFIRTRSDKLIVDEAQLAPELFNTIQVVSDERGSAGQYVLSGSQNFLLSKRITQSLAGRVGIIRLLPFSYRELASENRSVQLDDFMYAGGFPRIYDAGIPAEIYFRNYISTYLERDVGGQISPGALSAFQDFLALCAHNCGALLNITRLASDVGVSTKTARSWLSILEASYVVFRLQPYRANLRKRLTKTPKLYFHDTGLLCHLLGVAAPQRIQGSAAHGAIFENLIVSETLKRHLDNGREPRLHFYRDDSKIEVDLVDATNPEAVELVEIKASQTFRTEFLRHLSSVGEDLGVPASRRSVVMRSETTASVSGTKVWAAQDWLLR